MIVSTDKLQYMLVGGVYALANRHGKAIVCCAFLRGFIEIPDATAYWMEVSDTRKHGEWVSGEVWMCDEGLVWRVGNRDWWGFYTPAARFLRHHFKLSDKPKRLWCRLLYEE